jgi:hypothetical protein
LQDAGDGEGYERNYRRKNDHVGAIESGIGHEDPYAQLKSIF